MTYSNACKRAAKLAKSTGHDMYVVMEQLEDWSGLEDGDEWEYFVTNDEDLDTYFLGLEPIAVFGLDGERID